MMGWPDRYPWSCPPSPSGTRLPMAAQNRRPPAMALQAVLLQQDEALTATPLH